VSGAGDSKVALLILRDEGIDWNDAAAKAMFAKFVEWTAELAARGVLQGVEGLTREGRTVRRRGAGLLVDGPFAEGREAVLGFVAVRAADLDEACRLASESPFADLGGAIEVRMTSAFPKPVASGQSAGAQRGGGP
jgi:hypothetical protein